MKATKTLMVAALAAAGLGMADMAAAQAKHGGHGYRGGHHNGHGHRHGHRHWHGHGHRHWYPRSYWGWTFGVPLAIGAAWAWHDPYWYGPRVVYREVVRDEGYVGEIRPLPGEGGIRYEGEARPEPAPAPAPAPGAAPKAPAAGAPTTGPLYMNYCESARAYYPKVTSCPEGWKFQTPSQ